MILKGWIYKFIKKKCSDSLRKVSLKKKKTFLIPKKKCKEINVFSVLKFCQRLKQLFSISKDFYISHNNAKFFILL